MSEFPVFIMFLYHTYFPYNLYHFLVAQQCTQAVENTGLKKDLGSNPSSSTEKVSDFAQGI